jgi:hypothetical protein
MIRATIALAFCALAAGPVSAADDAKDRVFEMRTYHAHEGKGPDMHKRFREHTCDLFKKHGMELVGFWTPTTAEKGKDDTLVYILAYPSMEAREKSWKAFQDDPEWKQVFADSHKNGPIVKKVDQLFLNPTDYSPIK